jgi:hypothetical protein
MSYGPSNNVASSIYAELSKLAHGEGFFDGNIFVMKLPSQKATEFFKLL